MAMVTLQSPWPSWLLSGPSRFDAVFIGWTTSLAVQESSRATIPINPTLIDVESLGSAPKGVPVVLVGV